MNSKNYFLILGMPPTNDISTVDAAYITLSEKLKPANFADQPNALEMASSIFGKVREAHAALQDEGFRSLHAEECEKQQEQIAPDKLKPFLGHVCVAAGIISYPDLLDAITKQTDIDLPLGQILQERRLISQTELEGMLMGQKLYGAPTRPLEPIIRRLLALDIVTLDMIKIALIDQRTSMESLDNLMVKRGWIEKSVLEALK